MAPVERSAASLWQDYLFLTNEMLKFVSRREMEMFYSLLEQRDRLQSLLTESADGEFRQSAAGKELLGEIVEVNRTVDARLKLVYNQACRQQEIAQSYEGTAGNRGARIDFQR